jgi:voltage-gated potassium channel
VGGSTAQPSNLEAVDERAKRIEAAFEWPMVIAALLVIPVIWIEAAEPGEPLETIGAVLNWLTWGAFLTELVVMIYVCPRPREWLRRHPLDAVVVVLSPPFIPGSLAALRLLRLGRVLRLARLFSLKNLLSLEGIRYAAFLALFVVLLGGAAYASVESDQNLSTWDGIWWAVNDVTTVGTAGAPDTTEGRIIAMAVMFVGIGFVALLTAFIADRFIRGETEEISEHERHVLAELRRINERLDRLDAKVARAPEAQ